MGIDKFAYWGERVEEEEEEVEGLGERFVNKKYIFFKKTI